MSAAPQTAVSKTPEKKSTATESVQEPDNNRSVAELAYSYWLARGCPDGSADEDWFRAESELNEARSGTRE